MNKLTFSNNDIKRLGIEALQKAYNVHETLGIFGEETIRKNEFGDTALKVDIEAEEAIINFLKEQNFPIRIVSEEHGTIDLSNNPLFLGVLDGLDGSSRYKSGRGINRYGTMFGIFDGINPNYDDYLFSGVFEHSKKRLFYALKNQGSFLVENDVERVIKTSGSKTLDDKTRIYIDEDGTDSQKWFSFMRKEFSYKMKEFKLTCLGASCVYYIDVASGTADLALECTRKGNLEIAIAYGLEKESGGVMMEINGEDLGNKKYLEFSQDKYTSIITASTKELANHLIQYLKK